MKLAQAVEGAKLALRGKYGGSYAAKGRAKDKSRPYRRKASVKKASSMLDKLAFFKG